MLLGQQTTDGVRRKRKLEKSLQGAIEKFQFLLDVQEADFESEGLGRFPKFNDWFRQTITDVYGRTIPDTTKFLCEALGVNLVNAPTVPEPVGETTSKKRKIAEVIDVEEECKVIPTKRQFVRKEAPKPSRVTFRTTDASDCKLDL